MGFIDLHCHILPGVDDGALDMADSVTMARRAVAEGFEAVCATPHIRADHDVRIGEIAGRVGALGEELDRRGIPLRILTGGEVSELAVAGLSAAELRAVALGGGRWILLEPRAGPLSDTLDDAVGRLEARGFHALIAHPERHLGEDLFERLARLTGRGALVQATAAFFEQAQTARGMATLAARGLVHVLGSDAHSSHGGRAIALRRALDALAAVDRVAAHLDWIAYDAPAAILAGTRPLVPYAVG
jgi:protein-tyrosine phosphatase